MPVPYADRKKRRQQLAEELLPDLRGRIALRHVEAVSQFSSRTQRTLAEALEAGLRAPAAIAFLKEHPEALLTEVVAELQYPQAQTQEREDHGQTRDRRDGSRIRTAEPSR